MQEFACCILGNIIIFYKIYRLYNCVFLFLYNCFAIIRLTCNTNYDANKTQIGIARVTGYEMKRQLLPFNTNKSSYKK